LSLSQTSRRLHCASCILSLVLFSTNALAQALASGSSTEAGGRSASAITNDAGPTGIIPFTRGFNASVGATSQRDSGSGWSSILTPDVAFRFNPLFSLSASVPVYAYINVEANTGTKSKPVYTTTTKHSVLGDASLAAHIDTHASLLDYNGTLSLGLPSGNTAYGLGAGKVTADFNNHIEKSLGIFSPDLEFGIGNSSGLIGTRVRKSYTSVGTLAHFQAGASIDLPLNMDFEANLYEELPLNASTLYSITGIGRKKANKKTTTTAEDNGFNTSFDVPFGSHLTLSGFFNRSLRTSDNVAGMSATFLLKAPPAEKEVVR
jgi:hypothetical protein